MLKVAVTDHTFDPLDVEQALLRPLGCEIVSCKSIPPPAELASLVRDADAVITQFAPVTAAIIAAMTRAKVIVRYGVGVDNVDLEAARLQKIPVCNVPDYCVDEVADHTLALVLALTRQVVANCSKVRSGAWGLAGPLASMKALCNLSAGVVGYGRIGRAVVQRLHGFRCRILVCDPAVPEADIRKANAEPAGLDEVLRQSDILTLHCPSTPQTRRLLNRDTLSRMKPGALLVNVGRGDLVESPALLEALEQGRLAGAALDVFDPEPIPPDHPILRLANVIVSAHVASTSEKAARTLRETAALTVARALRGEPLPNVVNGVS